MLHVACVKVGKAYGPEYVNTLFDMVRRNLQSGFPGRFVCFSDDASGLDPAIQVKTVPQELAKRGWWAKLYLFAPDSFPEGDRVLYFDLDTAITGPLDQIAAYSGPFAILRDAYRPNGLQSSVMAWEAGTRDYFWNNWVEFNKPDMQGGDQAWLESLSQDIKPNILQDLFPNRFRSFKVECHTVLPAGTSVVFFHGLPRPHQVRHGWVPEVWKVGGGSGIEWVVTTNTDDDTLRSNVRYALSHAKRWLEPQPENKTPAIIVGGGPSLEEYLFYIHGLQLSVAKVFATNNAYAFLKRNGIQPDAHVMLDARVANLCFVPEDSAPKYYASQCHPHVLEAAGSSLICWHAAFAIYQHLIEKHPTGHIQLGGGTTAGLKAIALAYVLGHRDFRLFGFDSSYRKDVNHAYDQPLNNGERIVDVRVGGQIFKCAPWMVAQSEEFKALAVMLTKMNCMIRVYGDGLIPHLAQLLQPNAIDERSAQILKWLEGMENPIGAEIGVFAGGLSARLLARHDLTLYMVDSWAVASPNSAYAKSGDFHSRLSAEEQNNYFEATKEATAFAGIRARIMPYDSLKAAQYIENASLDFVFIDADHSYEGCSADIAAWLPKIKPTGFISGHDYDNTDYPDFGVTRAVREAFGSPILGDNFTWRVNLKDIYAVKRYA